MTGIQLRTLNKAILLQTAVFTALSVNVKCRIMSLNTQETFSPLLLKNCNLNYFV